MTARLTIGELSERSGVATSALRYYEDRGPDPRPSARPATSAATPRATLRRVAFIRSAQRVGLTLDEIAEALATLPEGRTPTKADWARLSPRLAAPARRADRAARAAARQARRLHRLRLPEPADLRAAATPTTRSPPAVPGAVFLEPGALTAPGLALAAMALRIVATKPEPGAGHAARGTSPLEEWGDDVRRPAPPRPLPARRADRPARRRTSTPSRRPASRWRHPGVPPAARPPAARAARGRAAVGVVTGREDARRRGAPSRRWSPEHLQFSLPYRSPVQPRAARTTACRSSSTRSSCCWCGCTWPASSGATCRCPTCCSGAAPASFAAYLVDAETGELHDDARPRPCASTTSRSAPRTSSPSCSTSRPAGCSATTFEADEIVERLERAVRRRCGASSPASEEFTTDEMWRIEQRIERLNDLGFDVDELDIVTDCDGDRIRDPAQGRRGSATTRRELQRAHRPRRRGQPGPPAAQRPRGVHRAPRPRRRGPLDRRAPLADRGLRADHARWSRRRCAASSSRPRSSTRSSSTAGTSPSSAGHQVHTVDAARDLHRHRAHRAPRGGHRRRRRAPTRPSSKPPSRRPWTPGRRAPGRPRRLTATRASVHVDPGLSSRRAGPGSRRAAGQRQPQRRPELVEPSGPSTGARSPRAAPR